MKGTGLTYWLICGVAVLAIASGQARAQRSGTGESSVKVVIVDPAGAAIPGAQVRLGPQLDKAQAIQTDTHGEANFTKLSPGLYRLRVEAKGFELLERSNVVLRAGQNHFEVHLEISKVREETIVQQDKREAQTDLRGNAFTTVLTAEQIAQLPDDPEEFEAAIRQMAGPGAVFRVNGFRGGKLPPKSQIREIRFRLDPFAAENHEASFININVTTKPGINNWHGSFNAGFRDESLNARNAFAPVRGAEQFRRFGLDLSGPLWRNHTSLFLSADGTNAYDSKTIVAALPGDRFSDVIRQPSRKLNLSARVEHVLAATHTLRAEYQRNANRLDNLGVGNFDLPERAYSTDAAEHVFRLSDSGAIGKKMVNEFRFQARRRKSEIDSISDAPTIIVLNAFNSGGAQLADHRRDRDFELADNVDFGFGMHAMRAGLLLEGSAHQSHELRNFNGTFTFASLDAYRAGLPAIFNQRLGAPSVDFTQYQVGWYWQDDFRVFKGLSMSFGIRHEWQTTLEDHNNFAPRFGLAWSPFKEGKTTIRASAGIFYDWFEATAYENILRVDGRQQRDVIVSNPGFPDPFAGRTQFALPPSRIVRDPAMTLPYLEQFSTSIQRQLPSSISLIGSYFYQRGVHLLRGHNINAPVPGLGRPDPGEGNITSVESSANSSRHSLSINLNWVKPKRLALGANYTLSKITNETDGPLSLPADNFNLRADRGPALLDSRHRFVMLSYLTLFKELRLGTTFNFVSALPYNITTGFDNNGDTVINDRPRGVARNSARGAAQWNMNLRLGWGIGFGTSREATSRAQMTVIRSSDSDPLGSMGTRGTASNRWRAEFYLQAFNVFNHVNPVNFTGVQTSPFFGRATAALPGRRMEVGMRFNF